MTTEIGKELRKLRIDREERLMDMAKKLEKSASFISAVERGDKSPPTGFEEMIINAYGLVSDAADALRRAADRSRKSFTLEPTSPLARDTAGLLARRINSLSDEQWARIRNAVERDDKKK